MRNYNLAINYLEHMERTVPDLCKFVDGDQVVPVLHQKKVAIMCTKERVSLAHSLDYRFQN